MTSNNSQNNKKKLNKIGTVNALLEGKALALAQLRTIPTGQEEVLKLLDLLFDAKRLHTELLCCVEGLEE